MKMVMIEDLKAGMILAEPVIGNFELIYANSDETITEQMIEGFERLNVAYVFIKDDVPTTEVDTISQELTGEMLMASENYGEMLDMMRHVFSDFQFLDKKVLDKVKTPMDDLINSVSKNTGILLKLKRLYLKDEYSLTHSVHVCLLSAMIAKWNGLGKKDIQSIALAGLFHDLGKSKIPDDILNKPGDLEPHEFSVMKRHSELGYKIARSQDVFEKDVLRGIIEHHERLDGSGYPFGLKKDQIHPYAQIIAIADVYDAMTTERSYKNSESPFVAVEVIKDLSYKNHLHPGLVNRFLKNIYRLYIGSEVVLSNGLSGEIVYINKFAPERPLIRLDNMDFIDLYTRSDVKIKNFKIA
ncbi:HD-GYP domain-containing protein [Fusibacter sp. JL216-2]|uniref:HD-GYP domain-containing protein n=1 Tax=Fusibacter sp. JL216-2 TaxID=3071453 RepID=UPI003D331E7A